MPLIEVEPIRTLKRLEPLENSVLIKLGMKKKYLSTFKKGLAWLLLLL
jgi:hypothetical protein